ncbi:MAG TPA: 3-deoxy-D-arabino-heptulosonate 7-phosphate synthase [Fibrobacteria bacterium]|nr:3-deoxy-D-arabino-heptulosonate 7-phosphate synthase [Fibrobacteria bacterium]HOX52659.1 3-deoxy-D-arabino-heptulosonate 7-phosphate synthase [Fibrobacteria bacterium]
MILPRDKSFSANQLAEVESILADYGCSLTVIAGTTRTIYAISGDERDEEMVGRIEGLEYVERFDRIQAPYRLMHHASDLSSHRVRIGGEILGHGFHVIAGQCTIDPRNPQFFLETAHAVKEAGAVAIRGGVWKPRTSPNAYQGDDKALEILIRARAETGLPVSTEVMEDRHLQVVMDAGVDIIQIGTRNALNYGLLKQVGRGTAGSKMVVLLKRGMHMGPVDEFICAAEYIVAGGNPNVVLCPRGTKPELDGYRNFPDESITPLLKGRTWAPVVVDPSHAVGKASLVPFASLAAAAYGADGLNVETHVCGSKGIGDDPKQSITPAVLAQLIRDAKEIHARTLGYRIPMTKA